MGSCCKCKKDLIEDGVAIEWFTVVINNKIQRACKKCMYKYGLWKYWIG